MPATNERVPQRPMTGTEVSKLIQNEVARILARDGMYTSNIAYSTFSFEVRISLNANIGGMPQHVTTVLSQAASKSQLASDPTAGSVQPPPLDEPQKGEEQVVSSTESKVTVGSPNLARIVEGMPIPTGKNDPETNLEKTITYEGDMPSEALLAQNGNKTVTTDTSEDQDQKWREERAKKAQEKKRKGK